MRPLDLYSEKTMRDGSPDKIASSSAFLHEANGLCLSSIHSEGPLRRAGGVAGGTSKSGLFSAFGDNATNKKSMRQRDQMAMASVAMCNPLMLLGMGASFAIADEMRMARERALGPYDNSNEELYKAGTVRELKKSKLKESKESKGEISFKPSLDAVTMSLQVLDNSPAAKKKSKLSFLRDRVSISRGVTMSENRIEPRHTRDWVKANKLLKQKMQLKDYLEKSRGKLDIQTVSNLMSQMEHLDKALGKYGY
jgi:hypothetical protein